jgi:hypothetical protein
MTDQENDTIEEVHPMVLAAKANTGQQSHMERSHEWTK